MYKIALMTAHIGFLDKPELQISVACEKELRDYRVDVYRFNNDNIQILEENCNPILAKDQVVTETKWLKFRRWYKSTFVYRQSQLPSNEENKTRLLAKIPKILFYKVVPEKYDYFVWCDSKFTLQAGFLEFVLTQISQNPNKQIITSLHSERNSIQAELDYMIYYMHKQKAKGLLSKYTMIDMDQQVFLYKQNPEFRDDNLYELGITIYSKDILKNKDFLEEWFAHNYYYTIQDQLSFPFLISKHKVDVFGINHNVCQLDIATHKHY